MREPATETKRPMLWKWWSRTPHTLCPTLALMVPLFIGNKGFPVLQCPRMPLYIVWVFIGRSVGGSRRGLMARRAAKRLTPRGVLALTKKGYYADSDAVGLY